MTRLPERINEKYGSEEEAVTRAKFLAHSMQDDSFCVIESRGEFHVENGCPMIRTWEREVWAAGSEDL